VLALARPLALLAAFALCAAPGCGGPNKPPPKKVVKKKPTQDVQADRLLREAMEAEAAGQADVAVAKYNGALQLRPGHLETNQRLVHLYIRGGAAANAVEVARAFVGRSAGNLDGYRLLAEAQLAAGDYNGAAESLGELLSIDDEDANAYAQRGTAQVMAGRVEPGIEDIRKAV
jgi:tetratricopeptide (TPR) repeat protein